MRGSREDLPATIEADEALIQEAEWGDIHVGFETYHEDFNVAPLLKGLPDDMCQCPHYGYVLKGRMRVKYADREEVVNAGDAYYMAPGHAPIMEAGTEIVEFSPKGRVSEDHGGRRAQLCRDAGGPLKRERHTKPQREGRIVTIRPSLCSQRRSSE